MDRWDSWSDFGNSVDCNLERKIPRVHGRPGPNDLNSHGLWL